MQLIFMVETNKNCQSDWIYINTLIKEVYDINSIKLSPVYMCGKGNYQNKNSLVKKLIKDHNDDSKVFVCVDLDKVNSSKQDIDLNEKIEVFCSKNNYTFIWFKTDIEDVFLGNPIENSRKKISAETFLAKNNIKKVNLKSLNKKNRDSNKTSNILYELDKLDFMKRK